MLYAALATDYDGTIALHGKVPDATVEALRWLKQRAKTLILVTGRELPELQELFPEIGLFDAVVAENGALLFLPGEGELRALADPPPPALVEELRLRDVSPLSVGSSVIATWSPHETVVLELIRELGLEWQITFNKGAVMCLPPGINKASGLAHALLQLKLSPLNVIAVGDAENDHAFLKTCGYSVAVANALDAVKQEVDWVTRADHGAGVCELIHAWMAEPETFGTQIERHALTIDSAAGEPLHLFPAKHSILIAGGSGAGKSSFAMALMELILGTGAQLIGIDPEGDYEGIEGMSHLGTPERPPSVEEACALLDDPQASLMLSLLALSAHDRPAFLAQIMAPLSELRATLGRPHWILVDEAHHFLPAEADLPAAAQPKALPGSIFITVDPRSVAADILRSVNLLIVSGSDPGLVIDHFCAIAECRAPPLPPEPKEGEAWIWDLAANKIALANAPIARADHQRHIRKYAEGHLSDERSFFFRGPENRLNLRARNLLAFLELANGVDDETWLYHLSEADYSSWLREAIGDDELADEVEEVEVENPKDADKSRTLIRSAIERRYTAPTE
jgi:hydroxymethylpyrimidine pyrophosphatase-like HAD family hydrolase